MNLLTLFLYPWIRYGFEPVIDSISPYAMYGVEVVFITLGFMILRPKMKTLFSSVSKRGAALQAMIAFSAGVTVMVIARALNLNVPFDFASLETWFFLLLFGPILEELLFRFWIWDSFASFGLKNPQNLVWTSAFFGLSHLTAYQHVPDGMKSFVVYQLGYTLVLGYFCGRARIKHRSMIAPMIFHSGFNLGFGILGYFI